MQQPDQQTNVWQPAAIVWDLDGTLIESAPDLAAALNTLLNEQGRHGHSIANVRPMVGGGVAKLIERGFEASGPPLGAAECEHLVTRFMELYAACATRRTHLVPAARAVLQHFYDAGLPQAVCTNKPLDVTRVILDALDIAGYFASVIGGDSTAEKKPNALPLLAALSELGVASGEALMVGDSAADVGAAHAAGVMVVLVPDGYTGAPASELGADHVIARLADLPAWLDGGGRPQRRA